MTLCIELERIKCSDSSTHFWLLYIALQKPYLSFSCPTDSTIEVNMETFDGLKTYRKIYTIIPIIILIS